MNDSKRRIAQFYKVSFKAFKECFIHALTEDEIEQNYTDFDLPQRATSGSAGYDFVAPAGYIIQPDNEVTIATGVKCQMNKDYVLLLTVRSSLGFKHGIQLANTMGVIDSDYYNNPNNEGQIFIKLKNTGSQPCIINKGERFAQGLFVPFGITNDDNAINARNGGIGSTNK